MIQSSWCPLVQSRMDASDGFIFSWSDNLRSAAFVGTFGGFHKWGFPKWLVHREETHSNWWFRPPFQETPISSVLNCVLSAAISWRVEVPFPPAGLGVLRFLKVWEAAHVVGGFPGALWKTGPCLFRLKLTPTQARLCYYTSSIQSSREPPFLFCFSAPPGRFLAGRPQSPVSVEFPPPTMESLSRGRHMDSSPASSRCFTRDCVKLGVVIKVWNFAMFWTKLIVNQWIYCTSFGWCIVGTERVNHGHACTFFCWLSNINVYCMMKHVIYIYIILICLFIYSLIHLHYT